MSRPEVWDTGLGIPASKQKVVFRGSPTPRPGAKVVRGLGLGLSIVERIGRVLEHSVTLSSEPGRGSVFRVTVPLIAAPAHELAPLDAPRAPLTPLMGLRVLAVDNEPAILRACGPPLRLGLQCCLRDPSALAAIRVSGIVPDVILADYHLDEGNGLDVIKTLVLTSKRTFQRCSSRRTALRLCAELRRPPRCTSSTNPSGRRRFARFWLNGVRAGWPRNEPLTRRRSVRPREYRAPARS